VALIGCLLALPPGVALSTTQPALRRPPGSFYTRCLFVHSLPDDPIVYPGQPGASHQHDFYANTTTDAYSTIESLENQPTSCLDTDDHAAYWIPQPFLNGFVATVANPAVYYTSGGFRTVETIPHGAEIIAGDAHAPGPQPLQVLQWSCGQGPNLETPVRDHPYDCTPFVPTGSPGVTAIVSFPPCWDGLLPSGNDSADFAYPTVVHSIATCPIDFPHQIAQLRVWITFKVINPINPDGTIALSFSSGAFYTLHADFMNAWDAARLQFLVDQCLNGHQICKENPPG
jgi:hypothetical protein